ncbi:unnamed protein product, partial [marine sediment metagenome]
MDEAVSAVVVCWICSSTKFVDNHHIDCLRGKKSDETVPLCRRCHMTYHNYGLEWFDDAFLDKALELENKRRQIFGHPPLRKEGVKFHRSDYWYKVHGIKRKWDDSTMEIKEEKNLERFEQRMSRQGIEPLCGRDWLDKQLGR